MSFYLDTRNMDFVIEKIRSLAEKTEQLKADLQKNLTSYTFDWGGKSRSAFDKKSHMLLQQITDVSQSLFDISEELLSASTAYMQADMELAKAEAGSTEYIPHSNQRF